MPNPETFIFKKFKIEQSNCAMKIGTDSVLLGAWTSLDSKPNSILDIGTGTGVLALMLAQRSPAELIDALEIDSSAYEQCVENFEQSIWCDRLFCYHAALEEFTEELDTAYDLIICNPPFYTEDYKTGTKQRDLARFQDAMPFRHLLESVSKLLSKCGKFAVVIPFKEEQQFITLACTYNLFLNKVMHVRGHANASIKRTFLEFSFQNSDIDKSDLTIEISRHNYTEKYITLTKDFYLHM